MEACPFSLTSFHPQTDAEALRKILFVLEANGFVHDEEEAAVHIVLGGDGSLLSVMHQREMRGSYLLINSGHLGFFSDYDVEELDLFLEDILSAEPLYESLPRLAAEFLGRREDAVSDIVLQSSKTLLLTLYCNNQKLTECRSSGIVIGTPVSSTAYLGSLSSPAVLTDSLLYQYSFIAPVRNRLFPNPIEKGILSKGDVLEVEASGEGAIFVDGIARESSFSGSFRVSLRSQETPALLHFRPVGNVQRIQKALTGRKEDETR